MVHHRSEVEDFQLGTDRGYHIEQSIGRGSVPLHLVGPQNIPKCSDSVVVFFRHQSGKQLDIEESFSFKIRQSSDHQSINGKKIMFSMILHVRLPDIFLVIHGHLEPQAISVWPSL